MRGKAHGSPFPGWYEPPSACWRHSSAASLSRAAASIQFNLRQTSTTCMDIFKNTATVSATGRHYRLRQQDTSVVSSERLAADTSSAANIDAHLTAQNLAGTANNSTVATSVFSVANGTCSTP